MRTHNVERQATGELLEGGRQERPRSRTRARAPTARALPHDVSKASSAHAPLVER